MGYFNFFGQYDYSMDVKFRLNIPSKFRKQMDPESGDILILTIGVDRCVNVYPYSLWREELQAIRKLDKNQPENRQFIRLIGSSATDCQLDKQGRIIIPTHLREYASLTKDVKVVGVFDKIELWNPTDFDRQKDDKIQDLSSLAQQLSQKND